MIGKDKRFPMAQIQRTLRITLFDACDLCRVMTKRGLCNPFEPEIEIVPVVIASMPTTTSRGIEENRKSVGKRYHHKKTGGTTGKTAKKDGGTTSKKSGGTT